MKGCMADKDHGHILFVLNCFRLRGRQTPEYPKSSSMADDTITWDGEGLGSPLYIVASIDLKVCEH